MTEPVEEPLGHLSIFLAKDGQDAADAIVVGLQHDVEFPYNLVAEWEAANNESLTPYFERAQVKAEAELADWTERDQKKFLKNEKP